MEPTMQSPAAAPAQAQPAAHMSTLSYQPEYSATISRLFIFRGLTLIIEYWVMLVWMIWIELNMLVEWLYMLFLGRRSEGIWRRKVRFMRHMAKWQAYLAALVDQRPQWIED